MLYKTIYKNSLRRQRNYKMNAVNTNNSGEATRNKRLELNSRLLNQYLGEKFRG